DRRAVARTGEQLRDLDGRRPRGTTVGTRRRVDLRLPAAVAEQKDGEAVARDLGNDVLPTRREIQVRGRRRPGLVDGHAGGDPDVVVEVEVQLEHVVGERRVALARGGKYRRRRRPRPEWGDRTVARVGTRIEVHAAARAHRDDPNNSHAMIVLL